MLQINDDAIYKLLQSWNPWWQYDVVPPYLLHEYHRSVYKDVSERFLDNKLRRFIILSGARRVGKTTIVYQLIDDLIKSKIPPKKILFFQADQAVFKEAGVQMILDVYHQFVYQGDDFYLFIDEIQAVENWEGILKSLYDFGPFTHTLATCFASVSIIKNTSDSGVGRFMTIKVPTVTFFEYCSLLKLNEQINLPKDLTISKMATLSKIEQADILRELDVIKNHFNRYLSIGGFPEFVLGDNDLTSLRLIHMEVIDKVLKHDIPIETNLRNINDLERIFLYICYTTSEIVSIETLTQALANVSRKTVEEYISYLVSGNLIYKSMPLGVGGKSILKASPKLYVASPCMRTAMLGESSLTDDLILGKLVETSLYMHIHTFYEKRGANVGYYRGGDNDKEIDIVIQKLNRDYVLVEAKYRNQAKLLDDAALSKLAKPNEICFLATKRAEDFGTTVTPAGAVVCRLPSFAFCYLLGFIDANLANDF
jgi:predicted AAA+ superfamily ATPase